MNSYISHFDEHKEHKDVPRKNITSSETASRHSVDETVFEPIPGHVFALPGKMTEAPYVADKLIRTSSSRMDLSQVAARPLDVIQG